MGMQTSGGGCGCAGGSRPPAQKSGACGETAVQQTACLQEISEGCNTDLNIVQGEDLIVPICFAGKISQVKCFNADSTITTAEYMGKPKKVRIACTGDEYSDLAGVYSVTSSIKESKILGLNGLAVATTKCFNNVVKNIPGCTSAIATQTPPTLIEHIDSSNWILEGSIYTRRSTTGSKKTFGAYVTSGSDTIYYTLDREVFVGDSVCVYLPGGTVKAIVLRVICDEIIDKCGNKVKATFLELDAVMPTVAEDTCVAISVDAGNLLDLDFASTESGCMQIRLPWTKTKALPFIDSCKGASAMPGCDADGRRFLGYWDIFATIPYLTPLGQLRTERKRAQCGCAYVLNSSAGAYRNC